MLPPISGYSNLRVNSVETTSEKDEFGQWLHTPNFRALKTVTAQAVENKTAERTSFATLLKQAEQDNNQTEQVELRPTNRFSNIDILA